MIIISKYLVPKGYSAITLFPFVILKTEILMRNPTLLNHEKIHLRQQLELLILPFYVVYTFEFVIKYARYKHWHTAYRSISFEKEAYQHENDLKYLKNRSFWNFIRYF